eukprot:3589120-Amphidinium_carterae.1
MGSTEPEPQLQLQQPVIQKDNKGKKGNKGKDGKGKKGQQQTQQFQGDCNVCGKWGHAASTCWYNNDLFFPDTWHNHGARRLDK